MQGSNSGAETGVFYRGNRRFDFQRAEQYAGVDGSRSGTERTGGRGKGISLSRRLPSAAAASLRGRLGAYWQSKGRIVIPTISWSDARSFEFCFDGVETGSTVAIGMIGCKRNKLHFLRGFWAMVEKIDPSQIICFGTPFPEMQGNLVVVDYRDSRKVVR